MMKSKHLIGRLMSIIALSILLVLMAGCGQNEAAVETTDAGEEVNTSANASPDDEGDAMTADEESGGNIPAARTMEGLLFRGTSVASTVQRLVHGR